MQISFCMQGFLQACFLEGVSPPKKLATPPQVLYRLYVGNLYLCTLYLEQSAPPP